MLRYIFQAIFSAYNQWQISIHAISLSFRNFFMEDIEVPEEHLHEQINETVEEHREDKQQRWVFYVAISTALMAVFAAVASLMAGHHSNEAVIEQIKASDNWAFYQAKGIKAEIKRLAPHPDLAAINKELSDQQKIKKEAQEAGSASSAHLAKHLLLARAVTLLQISIAVAAISILTRKPLLWYISLSTAMAGVVFLIMDLLPE
jgi:alpha-galactosidase/6-phospho-beta-glucosidase family protein